MDGDLSMGNFKGVMLCNRPAQIPGSLQTVVGPTSSSGPSRPAFVSSVVADDPLGLPPVRHVRIAPRRDTKNKSDDVTWRHKKWLGEFQQRRNAIEETMKQRVEQQEDRARRFQERSQAMRDAIRGIRHGPGDKEEKAQAIEAALNNKNIPTEYVDVSQQYPSGAPHPPQVESYVDADEAAAAVNTNTTGSNTQRSNATATKKAPKQSAKPGWARTASEDDDFLDAEADSLLNFAAGLDYQRYIDDLEVREAIKFVQDRVKNLEESKQSAEAEEEERARLIAAGELEEVYVVDPDAGEDENGEPKMKKIVRRVKKNRQPIQVMMNEEWNASVQAGEGAVTDRSAQQDQLTKTVLDSNRAMRNIHSSASVRAIMDKEGKAGAASVPVTVGNSGATSLRRAGGDSQRPPVITTIYEKDAAATKGPNPSNLPFLYRHPGI